MRFVLVVSIASAALLSTFPSAAVIVSFPTSDRYSDSGDRRETDNVIATLKQHLEQLGDRYLSPSTKLTIEILDIDLAGRPRYFAHRGLPDIRVLDGRADWPSIKLRYTLEGDGKAIESRDETVSDSNYLQRGATRPNEALYYEKRMLEDWFRKRFAR